MLPIIDYLKILFQKEARISISEILDIITKSTEWEKEITFFKGTFDENTKDRAFVMIEHIKTTLNDKGWDLGEIFKVEFVYKELLSNAYLHGLNKRKKVKVLIKTNLTRDYFWMTIKDSGKGFNLADILNVQKMNCEQINSKGLSNIKKYTTELLQKKKNELYLKIDRNQGSITVKQNDTYKTIILEGNIEHDFNFDDLNLSSLTDSDRVIINCKGLGYLGSRGISILTKIVYVLKQNRIKHIFLVNPQSKKKLEMVELTEIAKAVDSLDAVDLYFNPQ